MILIVYVREREKNNDKFKRLSKINMNNLSISLILYLKIFLMIYYIVIFCTKSYNIYTRLDNY